MRQLTLNEKISIKGQLASKGVSAGMLVGLGMSEALRLYWACFGRPASTHSLPTRWHKPVRRHKLVSRQNVIH